MTYARDGDIFVYDNTTGKTRQVTRTTDAGDESAVPVRRQTHFVHPRATIFTSCRSRTASLVQMTDIRAGGCGLPPRRRLRAGAGGRGGGGAGDRRRRSRRAGPTARSS